jgi:UDP-glucose 4-epimerase
VRGGRPGAGVVVRAIVTGGAGFIGSHVVDLLVDRGFDVVVIDDLSTGRADNLVHHRRNSRVQLHQIDVAALAPSSPVFAGVDYVFHLAGRGDIVPSIERPLDYMRVNVTGTLAVLEAARWAGARKVVYAASSSCYGSRPPVPTDESAPIVAEYPYALSKYLGECAVLHWGRVYGLPVTSIRIFNAFGPRARTRGAYGAVFGVFLAQKLKGQPFTIVGDGSQRRDFVYATDVATAFLLAAESADSEEVFNVGAGNPQSVNRLVELLGGETVHVPKRPGEPDCTWADIRKIRTRLGWTPRVSFEEGVARMLEAIDYWADAPVWTPEAIHAATATWFKYLGRQPATGKGNM